MTWLCVVIINLALLCLTTRWNKNTELPHKLSLYPLLLPDLEFSWKPGAYQPIHKSLLSFICSPVIWIFKSFTNTHVWEHYSTYLGIMLLNFYYFLSIEVPGLNQYIRLSFRFQTCMFVKLKRFIRLSNLCLPQNRCYSLPAGVRFQVLTKLRWCQLWLT